MSTSGSSSAEKRSRSTRVAPRRHVNPAEAAGAYDSGEFPVLLRMPDVSGPIADEDPTTAADDDASVNGAGRDAKTRTDRRSTRRHDAAERHIKGTKSPGSAVARFWAAMPPRIAAGGMLLGIIGLSFFLMRPGSTPEPTPEDKLVTWPTSPSTDEQAEQSVPSITQQPSELAGSDLLSETPNLYGQRSVVATKPDAPAFTDPSIPAPTFGDVDETVNDGPVTGWPEETEITSEQPPIEAAANPILPSLNQY